MATLKGHTRAVCYLAITPDGETLVSGGLDGTVRLWGIASGRNTATLQRVGARPALSPDGRTLATGNQKGIQLWDMPATSDNK